MCNNRRPERRSINALIRSSARSLASSTRRSRWAMAEYGAAKLRGRNHYHAGGSNRTQWEVWNSRSLPPLAPIAVRQFALFGLLRPWASAPLGLCAPGPLRPWASAPLGFCALGLPRPLGLCAPGPPRPLGLCAPGPLRPWASAPLGFGAPGPLRPWASAPLGFRAPGLLRPWAFAAPDATAPSARSAATEDLLTRR